MNLDPQNQLNIDDSERLSVQTETEHALCRSSDITVDAIRSYAKQFSKGLPQDTSLEAAERFSASSLKTVQDFNDAFEQILLTQAHLLNLNDEDLVKFCKTELGRERAPKPGTHATLAVAYVFRKAPPTSRGLHSQWASKAIYALANFVAPHEAAEQMSKVTLRECREKAAEYKRVLYSSHKPSHPRPASSITFTLEVRGLMLDFSISEKQFQAFKDGKLDGVSWKSVVADRSDRRLSKRGQSDNYWLLRRSTRLSNSHHG